MLRRKHKKTDAQSSNGSFSYSRVQSADMRSQSLQEENEVRDEVLSSSIDVDPDTDEKPAAASWSAEEKKIFEDQLDALQDQLISTMMENQKLGWYTFIRAHSHLAIIFRVSSSGASSGNEGRGCGGTVKSGEKRVTNKTG